MTGVEALPALPLPAGVRSRVVVGVNGLAMHVLEAGFDTPEEGRDRPCVLLLHGFPEIAYSWRKVMLPLAAAGYHVLAPDQRGYGRTRATGASGWQVDYDADLAPFRFTNLALDALALVHACGYRQVACVVGHDFGSPVAAWCALIRPDVFRSVVLMSAPFAGPASLPFGEANAAAAANAPAVDIHAALAALPRPRKHYQWYYGTRPANDDMLHCPQGVQAFLRAYYHHKSADWAGNAPAPLAGYRAEELAKLPTYYVMDHARTMPETVAEVMPTAGEIAACEWMRDDEMRVYADEYTRTGFQGGLQWYRSSAHPQFASELRLFSGRTIDVPSMFVGGRSDWGVYQTAGAFERMQKSACTNMRECHLLDGAGHWVQQEQAVKVSELLVGFIDQTRRDDGKGTARP
jgi:pimeloyl-ACP methyl ester carboxylesterase